MNPALELAIAVGLVARDLRECPREGRGVHGGAEMAIEPVTAVVCDGRRALAEEHLTARYCTALPMRPQSPSIDAGVPVVDELASFAFELSTGASSSFAGGSPSMKLM